MQSILPELRRAFLVRPSDTPEFIALIGFRLGVAASLVLGALAGVHALTVFHISNTVLRPTVVVAAVIVAAALDTTIQLIFGTLIRKVRRSTLALLIASLGWTSINLAAILSAALALVLYATNGSVTSSTLAIVSIILKVLSFLAAIALALWGAVPGAALGIFIEELRANRKKRNAAIPK